MPKKSRARGKVKGKLPRRGPDGRFLKKNLRTAGPRKRKKKIIRRVEHEDDEPTPVHSKKPTRLRTRKISASEFAEQRAEQKQAGKLAKLLEKATYAFRNFKVSPDDYGKLVMVGTTGGRNPQAKGRKGYLIHVGKDGRKKLVVTWKDTDGVPRARKITDLEPPLDKKLNKARKEFNLIKRVHLASGNVVKKGKGLAEPKSKVNDFGDDVVEKLSESLLKVLRSQRAHRRFMVKANVLFQLADGSLDKSELEVPINKPDHIAIERGGIVNFVRMVFYMHLARELEQRGYVTRGSSNHIRKLSANKGKDRMDWINNSGKKWAANESEVVRIVRIEWQIEQLK